MASDSELIQRIRTGDTAAFEQLVLRHRKKVYETAYRMVQNRETAEEIAQEVFLRVFRGLHSFRHEAGFTTWLYRIIMNVCITELNRRPHCADSDPEEMADTAPLPGKTMQDQERHLWLEREIQALPFKQRSVLILRIFQGMSFNEIAKTIGCSTNAAKVNYRHAFLKLKEKVGHVREEL